MKYSKILCELLLAGYCIFILCMTVWLRESNDYQIHRKIHWRHYRSITAVLSPDVINNILIFIPLGLLVGLLSPRYTLVKVIVVGFFVSETVECFQLIWNKGTFDVDDLLNNTVGAAIGGIIATVITWIREKR